jgi:gliding motility-associated-like protein
MLDWMFTAFFSGFSCHLHCTNSSIMKTIAAILVCMIVAQSSISQTLHPSFIKNQGQIMDQHGELNSEVLFLMPNARGMNTQLLVSGFSYDLYATDKSGRTEFNRIDIEFVGMNSDVMIVASDEVSSQLNYYRAGKSGTAISEVKHFNTVKYQNVYPNIDIVFTVEEESHSVKYDVVLHPGANIRDVRLRYSGFNEASLEKSDVLELRTNVRVLHESIPLSYYQEDGREVQVDFKLIEDRSSSLLMGFELNEPVMSSQTLVIDPVPSFTWGKYIGDSLVTQTKGVITDRFGFVYICGSTQSLTNIATAGAYQTSIADSINDAYVMKYNTHGNLIWSTYFGGDSNDIGNDVYVDTSFNVFLAGTTHSTVGIADGLGNQDTLGGGSDAFIAKFDENGMLQWSSYFGGDSLDVGMKLSTDFNENVYLTGSTRSLDAIASDTSVFQQSLSGEYDGFVVKYDSAGVLQWSSYLGGSENDFATGVAFGDTSVFVSGQTFSADFPVSDSMYQDSLKGLSDGFIAKLSKDGDLVWATYYGGENDDYVRNVKTFNNNVYFIGSTNSDSTIATTGSFQEIKNDSTDAFVGKMDRHGDLQWCTYYGGDSTDLGVDLFFELDSNIIVFGSTNSVNLPGVNSNSYQDSLMGEVDTYITKFSNDGNMMWSTYYGGELSETAEAVAVFGNTAIYVVGSTYSDTIFIPSNNIGGTNVYNSDQEGYLSKFRQTTSTLGTCTPGGGGGPNIWHCPGEEITLTVLGGELGTDATWVWYEGQCGNSPTVGSGDTVIVYPTVTTTYYVRAESITNATNCVSVTVNVYPTVMVEIQSDSIACIGDDYTLSVNGGDTVTWTGPNAFSSNAFDTTLVNVTDSMAGWYFMEASDSYGCIYRDSVDLTIPPPPSANYDVVNVSCFGYGDGEIAVLPDTTGYTYDWVFLGPPMDSIAGQDSLIDLYAGTYVVTITDGNGCSHQDTVEVDEPMSILLDTLIVPTACSDSSGAIYMTLSANTGSYTTIWSPTNQTGDSIVGIGPGVQYVVIELDSGCVEKHTFIVEDFNELLVDIDSIVPTYCAGTPTGSATATALNGSSPYTYDWLGINQQGSIANDLDSGTYVVMTQDANGCTAYDSVVISPVHSVDVNAALQASLCSDHDGAIYLTVQDLSEIQWFQFSNGEGEEWFIDSLAPGNYSVSILDLFGCQYDFEYTIDAINDLEIGISIGDTTLVMGSSTQLEVTTNYAGNFNYDWNPTDFLSCGTCYNPVVTPMNPVNYEVVVTDSAGCIDTAWLNIDISIPCIEVFIPDMFSPNGDQLNDNWKIIGTCLSSCHSRVYNQWGELLFESFDQSIAWDGYYRGERVPNDQYTYIVEVIYADGNAQKFSGFLTVMY